MSEVELRYLRRPKKVLSGTGLVECGVEDVLQYRNILSSESRLAIQTFEDFKIAQHYERWRDVPLVEE